MSIHTARRISAETTSIERGCRASGIILGLVACSIVALLDAGCSGTEPTELDTGSILVSTSTTGADLDPDGYRLMLDRGTGRSIEANGSLTFTELVAGSHSLEIEGVSDNCAVAGENPRSVDVQPEDLTEVAFTITCSALTGDVEIETSTTGGLQDPDGYTITLDGSASQSVAVSGTAVFTGVLPGSHSVELGGVAGNCAIDAENPRNISVTAGAAAWTRFDVSCVSTGTLVVATATSGGLVDPDGYTVALDGGAGLDIAPDGTLTFPELTPGDHDIELSGLAVNCEVDGTNPRSASVSAGLTTEVDIAIDCPEALYDRLAFQRWNRRGEAWTNGIWVMKLDGSAQVNLTSDEIAADETPAWSPDGTKIAFVSSRGGDRDIYVMAVNGSGLVNLTNSPGFDWSPAWSPDGSRIAFSSDRENYGDIYLINADGSNQAALTSDPSFVDLSPAWSPDGSRIAFTRSILGRWSGATYVMDADGSGLQNLTNSAGCDYWPSWSPDGSKIAFAGNEDCDPYARDIYVMNADGSGRTNLTNQAALAHFDPAWSPDGAMIAFSRATSTADTWHQIWLMNADGTGATRLTHWVDGRDATNNYHPTWSPRR